MKSYLLSIIFMALAFDYAAGKEGNLLKSCQEKKAEACYQLSEKSYEKKDFTTALQYAIKSCELDYKYGCTAAGNMYRTDKWIKKDTSKYLYYYKKACEYGDDKACLALGKEYQFGKHINKDSVDAIKYYARACDLNNSDGCLVLGIISGSISMEMEYDCIIRKLDESDKYLKKSCDLNNTVACERLKKSEKVRISIEGLNPKKYEVSCQKKDLMSCFSLGRLYDSGWLVERNYKKAYSLYKKACDLGNKPACHNLAIMYLQAKGVEVDIAKGMKLLKKSCDTKNSMPEACYGLGSIYDKGIVVDKNTTKAQKLYKKACNLGLDSGCKAYEYLRKIKDRNSTQKQKETNSTGEE